MNEIELLVLFCALYSGVVVLSLWMTIDQAVRVKIEK
jgi:hypothetical protein